MQCKHMVITRHGGPEVLQIAIDELLEPQVGEVRIRILATGVAFTDVLIREGLYPGLPKVPFTPGYEVVGIVDQVGSGVVGLTVGERVVALTVLGWYSEFICLPASECVRVDAAHAHELLDHSDVRGQLVLLCNEAHGPATETDSGTRID
jgi:NADPH:quinone reductase-like Zn-dependent oxidoreductase